MKKGLDYPLYVAKPNKINITAKQFSKLSYIGLASFLFSFPIVIEKLENEYRVYMREGYARKFAHKPRFEGLNFWLFEDAEMVRIDIPINNNLIETINKYFNHLILE